MEAVSVLGSTIGKRKVYCDREVNAAAAKDVLQETVLSLDFEIHQIELSCLVDWILRCFRFESAQCDITAGANDFMVAVWV